MSKWQPISWAFSIAMTIFSFSPESLAFSKFLSNRNMHSGNQAHLSEHHHVQQMVENLRKNKDSLSKQLPLLEKIYETNRKAISYDNIQVIKLILSDLSVNQVTEIISKKIAENRITPVSSQASRAILACVKFQVGTIWGGAVLLCYDLTTGNPYKVVCISYPREFLYSLTLGIDLSTTLIFVDRNERGIKGDYVGIHFGSYYLLGYTAIAAWDEEDGRQLSLIALGVGLEVTMGTLQIKIMDP